MRLGRSTEAVRETQALLALDPTDPRSIVFDRVAQRLAQLDAAPSPAQVGVRLMLVNVLPLLDTADVRNTLGGKYGLDLPLLPRGERDAARSAPRNRPQ